MIPAHAIRDGIAGDLRKRARIVRDSAALRLEHDHDTCSIEPRRIFQRGAEIGEAAGKIGFRVHDDGNVRLREIARDFPCFAAAKDHELQPVRLRVLHDLANRGCALRTHDQRLLAANDGPERIEIDARRALVARAARAVIAGALRPVFARVVQRLAELRPDVRTRIRLLRAARGLQLDEHACLFLHNKIGAVAEMNNRGRAAEHFTAIGGSRERARDSGNAGDGDQCRRRIDRIAPVSRFVRHSTSSGRCLQLRTTGQHRRHSALFR